MSNLKKDVQFPIGRILMGSLYKANDKDADGKPRIVKTGANAGQATQQFFFAVGIPKTKAHWAHESWGGEIWAIGNAAFPSIAQNPAFAWKIVDGDSQIPNKKGVKPADREGYPGNWVVSFASSFAPKVVNSDGSQYLLEPDYVNPGDFVEVHATVDGNGSTQNPGVYINHNIVSFQGYGQRIVTSGVDPTTLGFGKGPKPAGMSAVPLHSAAPAPAPLPAVAPLPAAPPPPALPGAPVPVPAAPLALAPVPSILTPPAPLPPPVTPARQMTAKAQGHTYESLIAQGWTDATLVSNGLMVGV
jgi:hypothetical protein